MKKKKLSSFEKSQLYIRFARPNVLTERAILFRKELVENETTAESCFKKLLVENRIRYEYQRIIYAGRSFYIVDFYLPKYGVVIEIDGIHHSDKDNIRKDLKRTKDLKKVGIKEVYRFKNEDVYNRIECEAQIKSLFKKK